jgi:hypothetical protein
MSSSFIQRFGFMLFAFLSLMPSAWAEEETDQVIIVPFSQQNPQLPHPAHEGAPITLKAIVRNAQCGEYRFVWDVNRNGNFDDEEFVSSRNGTTRTVYDIGRTFVVPYVDRDRPLNINVKVTPTCGGSDKYGTFKLFVYNFGENGQGNENLSRNPRNWTNEQFEILVTMAIQEALWHTHRYMKGYSGRNGTNIEAKTNYANATGMGQWFFVINNHLPAYPASAIPEDEPSPEGWVAANRARWNNDPYAESAMRLLNYNVARGNVHGVRESDEASTWGYRGQNQTSRPRIPNTEDRAGIYARSSNVYLTGCIQVLLLQSFPH